MEAIYGRKWLDQYPNEKLDSLTREEWAKAITCLSAEQIGFGLEICATAHQWPPTPAEFIKASTDKGMHNTAAYKRFERVKQIESDELKKERKKTAMKHIAEIKSVLKQNNV